MRKGKTQSVAVDDGKAACADWAAPIHDLLKAHGVDCVVHGHDHVTAVEFVDGVMYLELPWMKQGGASFEERVAYVGTKKAFYDEERPAYARFSAAGGGLALEVRDVYSDAVVYGYDFADIDSDAQTSCSSAEASCATDSDSGGDGVGGYAIPWREFEREAHGAISLNYR